jgi:hypothetical protein
MTHESTSGWRANRAEPGVRVLLNQSALGRCPESQDPATMSTSERWLLDLADLIARAPSLDNNNRRAVLDAMLVTFPRVGER